MSIEAVNWALSVPVGGNQKVILLGLANHAHPDGTHSFPALGRLAVYAHCDRSTARRNLRKLVDDGWVREDGLGPRGQTNYTLAMGAQFEGDGRMQPVAAAPAGGGTGVAGGVAPMPPEPSLEPSTNHPVVRAGAREVVRVGGKPVHQERWDLTAAILAEFNEQAGRKLRLLTSAGEPSDAAKRIYGRVRSYPDITLAEHADIVRRTLASRWWGANEPSIGVIYGPNVFEENITRPGIQRPTPGRGRGDDPAQVALLENMRAKLNAGEPLFGPASKAFLGRGA